MGERQEDSEMKRGQLIKIVASNPAKGQGGITQYIGRTVPVVHVHRKNGRETGEVSVKFNNIQGDERCPHCGEVL